MARLPYSFGLAGQTGHRPLAGANQHRLATQYQSEYATGSNRTRPPEQDRPPGRDRRMERTAPGCIQQPNRSAIAACRRPGHRSARLHEAPGVLNTMVVFALRQRLGNRCPTRAGRHAGPVQDHRIEQQAPAPPARQTVGVGSSGRCPGPDRVKARNRVMDRSAPHTVQSEEVQVGDHETSPSACVNTPDLGHSSPLPQPAANPGQRSRVGKPRYEPLWTRT